MPRDDSARPSLPFLLRNHRQNCTSEIADSWWCEHRVAALLTVLWVGWVAGWAWALALAIVPDLLVCVLRRTAFSRYRDPHDPR